MDEVHKCIDNGKTYDEVYNGWLDARKRYKKVDVQVLKGNRMQYYMEQMQDIEKIDKYYDYIENHNDSFGCTDDNIRYEGENELYEE